jgi:hypothetical protein
MFNAVRSISVCCTAVVLLVQPVYANSALNCGCRQLSSEVCATAPARCRCCVAIRAIALKGCPHCQESKIDSESADAEDAICHCGETSRAPNPPVKIPEKSGSESLSWAIDTPAHLNAAPMIRVTHAHPQLLAVAALINNSTQVAYCVWLI